MSQNLARASHGLCALLAAACIGPAGAQPPTPQPPLSVAFVYVSPVGEAGWTYQHELGRRAMAEALGPAVTTTAVESVPEGAEAERVIRDLAAQGHGLVFATSFGYLEPTLRVAADFPATVFEHAGGYRTAANVNTYNARFYEARYLAGMLAGRTTTTGVAGYVAGFPVPEVIQGINAFTLGMRSVRPDARVQVMWLQTWFDPTREREAAMAAVAQGADVLTNHSGSTAVAQAAQDRGVKFIGYQSDMRRFAPDAQLTAITQQWGRYYTQVARAVRAGTWKPTPVWGGLRDGMIGLSPFHPAVPADVVRAVRAREADIVAGRFHPFAGRLVDQAGQERQAGGRMDDATLARMNWFVQGVTGALPRP